MLAGPGGRDPAGDHALLPALNDRRRRPRRGAARAARRTGGPRPPPTTPLLPALNDRRRRRWHSRRTERRIAAGTPPPRPALRPRRVHGRKSPPLLATMPQRDARRTRRPGPRCRPRPTAGGERSPSPTPTALAFGGARNGASQPALRPRVPPFARAAFTGGSRGLWPVAPASRRGHGARLAAIRQVLAPDRDQPVPAPASRRSPVPRSRALWPVAPASRRVAAWPRSGRGWPAAPGNRSRDAHAAAVCDVSRLAAIRQVPPPPCGPPFARVAFTGGSRGCVAAPASRRGHGPPHDRRRRVGRRRAAIRQGLAHAARQPFRRTPPPCRQPIPRGFARVAPCGDAGVAVASWPDAATRQ